MIETNEFFNEWWRKHNPNNVIPLKTRKEIEDRTSQIYPISKRLMRMKEEADNVADILSEYRKEETERIRQLEGEKGYDKTIREGVRILRFVNRIKENKGKHTPLHQIVIEWNAIYPSNKKTFEAFKRAYHRAKNDNKVKANLFKKEYSEHEQGVGEFIFITQKSQVARQALESWLYDVAKEYGEIALAGTVVALCAQASPTPIGSESQVDFSDRKLKEAKP